MVHAEKTCDTILHMLGTIYKQERQEDRMNSHDWERFGEDIRRTIQDAVEYGNYDRLNQTITNTVNQAADWVNKNVRSKGSSVYQYESYQKQSYHRQQSELYEINTSSKVTGILLTVCGCLFGVPIFIWTVLVFIASIIAGKAGTGLALTAFNSVFLSVFCFMAFKGITTLTRIDRFKKYVKEIGNAEFCNITDLAKRVGKSNQFVVKDIEKMIVKGWLRQGHLDTQKTCVIVTDQMYYQYLQLEKQKELQRKEEEQRLEKQRNAQQGPSDSRKNLSPEVQKVIEQGDVYVRKIRECNDAIPGEEISAKIDKMEKVVDKIFDRIEQSPESVTDIRKLMEYYLPTTVKLLEAYAEMDAQPFGGENIQTAKREIEATLDTLNIAFEKLLDSLFQDAAWDVSSDISVLNAMLAQEGLKEDGLKK